MKYLLLAATAALLVGGCDVKKAGEAGQGSSASSGSAPSAAEAARIVDQAYASFAAGDPIKVMDHYAPDAVVFDAAHTQPGVDRSTITKWTAGFTEMKPSDFVTNPRIIQPLDEDTIISSGILAFLADVAGHRQRVSVRYTHVFERQPDGRWLIVAEHNSIPPEPMAPGL